MHTLESLLARNPVFGISLPVNNWDARRYSLVEGQEELTEEDINKIRDIKSEDINTFVCHIILDGRNPRSDYTYIPVTDENMLSQYAEYLNAKKEMADIVEEFREKICAAERIADKHGLSFTFRGYTYDGEGGNWSHSSDGC